MVAHGVLDPWAQAHTRSGAEFLEAPLKMFDGQKAQRKIWSNILKGGGVGGGVPGGGGGLTTPPSGAELLKKALPPQTAPAQGRSQGNNGMTGPAMRAARGTTLMHPQGLGHAEFVTSRHVECIKRGCVKQNLPVNGGSASLANPWSGHCLRILGGGGGLAP